MASPMIARIEQLIAPAVEDMGFTIVRIQQRDSEGRNTLQILAEPQDGSALTMEHCVELTHTISALLDVEDPITGAYALEVSSPGVDRPLTRPEDYRRFAGREIKLETHQLVQDRKRFKGRLHGLATDGASISLTMEEVVYHIPLADVKDARLIPDIQGPQPKKNLNPRKK